MKNSSAFNILTEEAYDEVAYISGKSRSPEKALDELRKKLNGLILVLQDRNLDEVIVIAKVSEINGVIDAINFVLCYGLITVWDGTPMQW